MPTLNWVYGAKTPDIEEAVTDAIRAAHQYRNKLCELELAKRERHEALLQRLAPDYVTACGAVNALETQLGEVREKIQAERKRQRTKTPKGVEDLQREAKQIKADLKERRAERKAAKQAAYEDPAVREAMDENAVQHKQDRSEAKSASGLYWGTEAVISTSCNSFAAGPPPRFRPFRGEGQLAVQLQGGLDCRNAFSPDTRLQILADDELQESLAVRGKAPGSLQKRAMCLVRIGSDENRGPIFARVPIVFHRPLPEGGKIKWAFLERRMIANAVKWKVRLTIDVPRRVRDGEGAVAIHVGWRTDDEGLRVATWMGSDGAVGTLHLDDDHCNDYLRVDAVRSERDDAFNVRRQELVEWLHDRVGIPEWLADARKTMANWRSPARLSGLMMYWRFDRFAGDADMFGELDAWMRWDKKRWQHERRLSLRIARRRKDRYRNFVAKMAKRYKVAYVSTVEVRKLVEHSDPEELERDNTLANRRAKWASVSELLGIVREKFGTHCVDTDPAGITLHCSECGERNPAPTRKVQCSGCLRTYDRDRNAAENTFARGEAAVESGALLDNEEMERLEAKKRADKLAKMQAGNRAARKRKREAVS